MLPGLLLWMILISSATWAAETHLELQPLWSAPEGITASPEASAWIDNWQQQARQGASLVCPGSVASLAEVNPSMPTHAYRLRARAAGPEQVIYSEWPGVAPILAAAGSVTGHARRAWPSGLARVSFLTPRGILLHLLVLGIGTSLLLFLASGWYPPSYRFGAISVAFLAVVTLMILLRSLRDGKPYRRWFALGLGASIVGGAAQAASVFMDRPPTLPLAFAFPFGTLIESVLWLVAIVSQAGQERRTF